MANRVNLGCELFFGTAAGKGLSENEVSGKGQKERDEGLIMLFEPVHRAISKGNQPLELLISLSPSFVFFFV